MKLFSKIDHPNIIKILEAYEDKFKIYFILDMPKGESLFNRIMNRGQIEEANSATIAAYLASIAKYLHKNGIILRNLRAETLVFEDYESWDLKLLDLSLAIERWMYREGQPDILFDEYSRLMPIYRAPELFAAKKKYDESVDLWSIGCLIFNMVTGVPPFYESDDAGLQNAIAHGNYEANFPLFEELTTPDLHELISKLLVTNAASRMTSDELVADKWINSAH